MSSFLFDKLHQGIGRVLDLRSAQHALTASNLANADTPGFKAKFIPFNHVLGEAMGSSESMPMSRSHPLHLRASETDAGQVDIEEIEAPPWSLDGNSVTPERESMRMAENAILYDALTRGLNKRLMILKYSASNGD
jgi:flagellar basal-body rod protein FlgB